MRTLIISLCVLALVPAASAQAQAPPKGKYDCTIGGGTLFGTLTIKKGNAYRHRGTKGSFSAKGGKTTYPDGIRAYKISFKKGSLDGFTGRWHKTSDGVDEIALENPKDGFESIYCDKNT